MEKLQIGCSIKQLSPDPFEHVENYQLNKVYKAKVVKLMDFGAFCELEPGLTTLLHSSELSWTKKNISAKKMFKVGDEIDCVITEIDKECNSPSDVLLDFYHFDYIFDGSQITKYTVDQNCISRCRFL